MSSIKEIILIIKNRPSLYLTGNSINLLNAFLTGWIVRNTNDIDDVNLLNEFQIWVQNKFHITSSQSWAKIILFFSNDEFEALKKFFDLFDEFLGSR